MKFGRFSTLLLLAAVPAAALAAQGTKDELDGPVTKAQVGAKLEADFADMDTDKDGKVTAAEVDARLVKSAEAQIEEIRKERDATFARLDANGDGSISKAEFDSKAHLPTAKAPDAKPFLDRFDANKDGSITLEEFRGPTLANFARMDINHDGTVTPDEMKRTPTTASTPTGKKAVPSFKKTPAINR